MKRQQISLARHARGQRLHQPAKMLDFLIRHGETKLQRPYFGG
jgi:hypothetical protein